MDYIKDTIERLQEYNLLVSAAENMKLELQALKLEIDMLKASKLSLAPALGSGGADDKLVNNINRRIELARRIKITESRIRQLEQALSQTNGDEKLLLEILFINGGKNSIEYACQRLGYEKSQLYQKRNEALRKCGRALLGYGIS